jgi:hypothetical protein
MRLTEEGYPVVSSWLTSVDVEAGRLRLHRRVERQAGQERNTWRTLLLVVLAIRRGVGHGPEAGSLDPAQLTVGIERAANAIPEGHLGSKAQLGTSS